MSGRSGAILAVLVMVWCAETSTAKTLVSDARSRRHSLVDSCESVAALFQSRNVTTFPGTEKGSICGGHCCNDTTEQLLKEQGRKDFATLLRHNSRSLLGPINRTSALLQDHIWELADQSENNTLVLFSQVYQRMAVLAKNPIQVLYQEIRDYVTVSTLDLKPKKSPEDIKKSVDNFFTDLFPLAYHQQTGLSSEGDFTDRYKQCLKNNMDLIVPFGTVPQEIAQGLAKSLESTRLLLQALAIGVEVLNTTDSLMISEQSATSSECHQALLKMTYCPKCLAITKNSKPCQGYCLNVLRGCISKYVTELDLPWASYVEGLESLINVIRRTSHEDSVDYVIKNLDTQISSAIMYCMEKIKEIDSKVKMNCKTPEFAHKLESLTAQTTAETSGVAKSRQPNSRSFPPFPDGHMASFLSIITKTKNFYADLADNLCGDESFTEQKEAKKCWNGEKIDEYIKPVVVIGMDMQKYNPEVKTAPSLQHVNPVIANLVDKLRHVHNVATTSVGPNYSDTYDMQRDGADGSGSGNGPDFDDSDDEYSRSSGSGDGPIETDDEKPTSPRKINFEEEENRKRVIPSVHLASGSSCLTPGAILVAIFVAVLSMAQSRN